MNKKLILALGLMLAAVLVFSAYTARPQMTLDEQELIVESVIQTLNPDAMAESIAATVQANILAELTARGILTDEDISAEIETAAGEAAADAVALALATPTAIDNAASGITLDSPAEESALEAEASATPAAVSADAGTADRQATISALDDPADYWEGAVLQDDGTYRGLHAAYVNSYAYSRGYTPEGEATTEFKTEFVPNEVFNFDIVFENDGSTAWPAIIEMRNTGNSGDYTGYVTSVIIDRTDNPVLPGDKIGFSISAHGSEMLGYHIFYFQLYDASSGSPIEGGTGSFAYLSK